MNADGRANSSRVLQVRNLRLKMPTYEGMANILNGVSLSIEEQVVMGLVGETGSGKTMTALAITGLLPSPPAVIEAEELAFKGESLLGKTSEELRQVRATHIGMVFQDPTSNLSPVLSIGDQMIDAILCRQGHSAGLTFSPLGRFSPTVIRYRRQARQTALEMLERVGIDDPLRRMKSYPHEFSGGMKQRTLIAMALAGKPELLIADEPTTALDVSVEAQILELVRELVREMGLAALWVTHNLGVVWKLCTHVAVMYAGAVVERCATQELFTQPLHPYTIGLLKALPKGQKSHGRLESIPGTPPNPIHQPQGCRFHPRCPQAVDICREIEPVLIRVRGGRFAACHLVTAAETQAKP